MKKVTVPTAEEAKAKSVELRNALRPKERKKRVSPVQDFLKSIKQQLRKAVNDGIPYKNITEAVNTTYGTKISQQSIVKFCKENFVKAAQATSSRGRKPKGK